MDVFAAKVVEVIFLLHGWLPASASLIPNSELKPDKSQYIPQTFSDTGVIKNVHKVRAQTSESTGLMLQ